MRYIVQTDCLEVRRVSSGKKKVRLQDIRPTMAGLDFMDEEFM